MYKKTSGSCKKLLKLIIFKTTGFYLDKLDYNKFDSDELGLMWEIDLDIKYMISYQISTQTRNDILNSLFPILSEFKFVAENQNCGAISVKGDDFYLELIYEKERKRLNLIDIWIERHLRNKRICNSILDMLEEKCKSKGWDFRVDNIVSIVMYNICAKRGYREGKEMTVYIVLL